ncbi:PEP_CTERM-anchored TLD domain-containing protein [Massilia sp. Leaf139]|uniref:PEP_CTERM-anchored TLD domain-containing protein n=1 Tax=Massilia sp. Leaf139 TaxID=1736272 RepID=UPI0006FC26C3|nr:PEP_CTERM-anchored TLD domain-containing protein [Massilia sp. Leaf139]KQQ88872.1 PEP-CTERM domain protein [Massilia sp. Leaf139]
MKTRLAPFAPATAAFVCTLACALAVPPAAAQSGAPPLDPVLEGQLERWLGAGDQIFENVYTRQGEVDDSLDFHAAADGRGPTFTLLRVSDPAGRAWLVGGYNPQSWDSDDGWHFTPREFQRTAFLFNYTEPAVYRQVPGSFELPSQGSFQTFNAIDQGPTFGAGPDLLVDERLDTALSWRLSYGDPAGEGRSIIDGSVGGRFFAVDAMEIYAVSPIPEPVGAAMLAGGLGVLALAARRRGLGSAGTVRPAAANGAKPA